MSKIALLFVFVLAFSCGEEVPRADQSFQNLGNIIAADSDESLTAGDQDLLQRACDALASKESFFSSSIVNNSLSYTYTQSESVCGAKATPVEVTYEVEAAENGQLSYTSDGVAPVFRYVETKSYGSVDKFCEKLDSLDPAVGIQTVPRYIQDENVISGISLFTDRSSVCSGDNDTVCVFVQFAYKLEDGKYRVDQIVKLSIDTDSSSSPKGIVEEKEVALVCSTDASKETKRKMTLKEE
jgi:hypothetical protein